MASLKGLIRDYVLKNGDCTVDQVLAGVGRQIDASQAATCGRRRIARQKLRNREKGFRCIQEVIYIGKRHLIHENLRRMVQERQLSRKRPGVYCPPAPKIYVPSEIA